GMTLDDYLADYALAEFQENHEGARELLFRRLAERLRNGTLQDHAALSSYLADACEHIAEGDDPNTPLGVTTRGRKTSSDTFDWGLRIALNTRYAMNLWPDKPQEEIFEIVAERSRELGHTITDGRVEQLYREHLSSIER